MRFSWKVIRSCLVLSHVYGNDCVISVFCSVNMVYHSNWFSYLRPCTTRMNPTLVVSILATYFCIRLASVLLSFASVFMRVINDDVLCSRNVFVWIEYEANFGFNGWVGKCFLFFCFLEWSKNGVNSYFSVNIHRWSRLGLDIIFPCGGNFFFFFFFLKPISIFCFFLSQCW